MDATKYPPALAAIAANRDHLDTSEFASAIKRSGQTVRKNFCVQGHAYGIRPKRVGGRLLWPIADVARLLTEGT